MDPITHTLLGGSIGFALFGKSLGRTAAFAGGLAAFIPDADVFIRSSADPLVAIEYHRHFTHSLFFAPIGAAIVAVLWMWRSKWRAKAFQLWFCCLAAYVSHCLLDSATTYGTQLLWPFTRERIGWDWISIIDPVFTVPLLIGLVWALITQKMRPVVAALMFASAYMSLGIVQHNRASAAQAALAQSRGHRIERSEVMPTLANNVVWRALYQHDGEIHSDRIRIGWFSKPTVAPGWSVRVVELGDLTRSERARNQHRSFERFNWFSEGWVARYSGDSTLLADMRYSLSTEAFDPIWGIRFTRRNAPFEVEWVNRSRERRIDLREFWTEVIGNDERFREL